MWRYVDWALQKDPELGVKVCVALEGLLPWILDFCDAILKVLDGYAQGVVWIAQRLWSGSIPFVLAKVCHGCMK